MSVGKTEKEKQTVETMIGIYCRGKHHSKTLCNECQSLVEYARQRLDRCPFAPNKPFCKHCKVHCYRSAEREKIRKVMRYAGPRMLFYKPLITVKHLFEK